MPYDFHYDPKLSAITHGARLRAPLYPDPEMPMEDVAPHEQGIPGSPRNALFYQDLVPLPMASHGDGIYIYDEQGRRYLDGCSGAICANLGHGNKRIAAVAAEQAGKIAFAYRTQFESRPANELADMLVRLAPPGLNRVFFVNSGSESVEAAIKLARQYWWSVGKQGKHMIIARRPSYHGATLGALSATAYAPLNIPYRPMSLNFPKISAPYCYHCPLNKEYPSCEMACARELERAIRVHGPDNIAAFITEPIGGASTGGAVPPPEWFPMVAEICKEYNILLIVDDVLTGCGRTGTFYGFEHWGVTPDIVALSKGLGAGYTPIGATVATDTVVQPVMDSGGFMHGHTYAGNPLSTAIAREVLKITLEEGLVENAGAMGVVLHEGLHELMAKYPIIGDVRGRGLLAGIEFVRDRAKREPFPAHWNVGREITQIARERGLLIYPRRSLYGLSGDHVLLAPPLIIKEAGIEEMLMLFEQSLEELMPLLDKHYEQDIAAEEAYRNEKRYELEDEIPAYALGDIEGVQSDPEANVTWQMREGETAHPEDLVEDPEIL